MERVVVGKSRKTVLVIFSLGMSLTRWKEMGLLQKEKIIFSQYLKSNLASHVILFTYDSNDLGLLDEEQQRGNFLSSIEVIPAPKWAKNTIGKIIYSLIAPLLKREYFKSAHVLINIQTSGAWTGLIAQLLLRKRFVYRYGHSLWRRHLDRKQFCRFLLSWTVDRLLTRTASYSLVCTDRDYRYANKATNINVCPNFIDTANIERQLESVWELRLERGVFVGRLMPFKNLLNLISACAVCNLPLDIIGDGALREQLIEHAKKVGADCRFLGLIPNEEIRIKLLEYKYFFLVSRHEGMPKALLEGMISSCVCIVSPHYGCTEIIDDKKNGLIATGYTTDAIVMTINKARSINKFRLASAAHEKVITNYSLNNVLSIHSKALNLSFSDDTPELIDNGLS